MVEKLTIKTGDELVGLGIRMYFVTELELDLLRRGSRRTRRRIVNRIREESRAGA